MANAPSMAYFGDDLTGAAMPSAPGANTPWGLGPSPSAPPAGVLKDQNVMWLDPGMLMEPGTGFGSAQKSDALGQAMDEANQFLGGGGGGGAKPAGGEGGTLQQMTQFAGRAGDIVKDATSGQQTGAQAISAAGLTPGQIRTIEGVLGPATTAELGAGPQGLKGIDLSRALAFAMESELGLPLDSLLAAGEIGPGAVSAAGELAGLSGSADLGGAATADLVAAGGQQAGSTLGTAAGVAAQAVPYLAALYALYSGLEPMLSGDSNTTGRQNFANSVNTIINAAGALLAPATGGISAFAAPVLGGFLDTMGLGHHKGWETRGERMEDASGITSALNRALRGVTPENLGDVLDRQVFLDPDYNLFPGLAPEHINWETGNFSVPGQDIPHPSMGIEGWTVRQDPYEGGLTRLGPVGSFLQAMGGTGDQYGALAPLLAGYGPTRLGGDAEGGIQVGNIGSASEWLGHTGGTVRNVERNPAFADMLGSLDRMAAYPQQRDAFVAEQLANLRTLAAERGLQRMGAQGAKDGRGGRSEEEDLLLALGMV